MGEGLRARLAARLKALPHEPLVLLAFMLIGGGVWAFAELADAVMERDTHALDRQVLLAMRVDDAPDQPIGPAWLQEVGRDLTALGGVTVMVLAMVATALYMLLRRKHRALVFMLATVVGGILLSLALKRAFDRSRPDLVSHGSLVYTASFPSGHAMMSAIVYMTLGALLARLHESVPVKLFLLGWAVLLSVLVGVSRVYLGVHWPTDVVAGWTVGATWSLTCWTVAAWLQRRGQIDAPTDLVDAPGRA